MGSVIRMNQELIGIPFLMRTRHPTTRFPCALMREDGLTILHINGTEDFIQHLHNYTFLKNNCDGSFQIQHNGQIIRSAGN